MLEETKKMVSTYGGEGATHKVWLGSMQRFPSDLSLRTTDGRMTDACATTVALLTKSSRAKMYMNQAPHTKHREENMCFPVRSN